LPTLLVFTASPADRAAPQKLAYQEIAGSAGDTERPEPGPGVERARIHPLALLSSPPGRAKGLAALCTSAYFRDWCTVLHKRKISAGAEAPHNHNKSLLLKRNCFRTAKSRVIRRNLCASKALPARNQTAPPMTHIVRPNREFVFSAAPEDRSSRAASPIRVYSRIRAHNGFRDPCTKTHKPKTAATCRSPDN
jgi:hypothetical protein